MELKRPLAVLVNFRELKWGSCKSISANLQAAYRLAFGRDVAFFPYEKGDDLAALWKLARELVAFRPSRVVFLDHLPHPLPLLRVLPTAFGKDSLPEFVFHTYGDFTLFPEAWLATEALLPGKRCLFVCASERHERLIGSFLARQDRNLALLRFPIDHRSFRFSPQLRAPWRRRLKIGKDDTVFLYSGRISLQKNVGLLIEELGALALRNPRVHLLLTGAEDDLDGPLFEINAPQGAYGQLIRASLENLPKKIRPRFRWLGAVSPPTLNGLYNAADVFISLGLHHDEDFGMSVAEAQSTGLPCILSDWGGFSSFVREKDDGTLVPVSLGAVGLRIARGALRKGLEPLRARDEPREKRSRRASRHQRRFSLPECAAGLAALHSRPIPPFHGYSRRLSWLAFHTLSSRKAPFPKGPKKNTIYEQVYQPYYEARGGTGLE